MEEKAPQPEPETRSGQEIPELFPGFKKREPEKIVAALLAIAAEVPAIGKDEENTSQNYNFRSIDAIMAALKPLLVRHQILVYPINVETVSQGKGPRENGFRVVDRIVYRFEHIDGSFRDVVVTGEGVDYGDKASNKGMTTSLKYALGQIFFIPYYSEADADRESPESGPPGDQKGQPARKEEKGKAAPPADAKNKDLAGLADRLKRAGITGERALSWIMVRIGGRKIGGLSELTEAEFLKINAEAAKLAPQQTGKGR